MECERKCVWKLWIQLHCIPALCSKVCDPSCHNNESQVTVCKSIELDQFSHSPEVGGGAYTRVVIIFSLDVLPLLIYSFSSFPSSSPPSLLSLSFSSYFLFSPPPSLPFFFLSSHLPPVMYFVVSFTALLEHTSRRLLPLSQLPLSV